MEWLTTTRQWAEYIAVRALVTLASRLPVSGATRLGRWMGSLVYYVCPIRYALVSSNLWHVYPHDPWTLHAWRVKKTYQHVCVVLLLVACTRNWTADKVASLIDGDQSVDKDLMRGGAVVCTGHVGVWELLPQLFFHLVHQPITIVYRPLHNVWMDHFVSSLRRNEGITLKKAHASIAGLCTILREGTGLVGLVADQSPRTDCDVHATFLSCPLVAFPGIGVLQTRTACPVWFAALLLNPRRAHKPLRLVMRPVATRGDHNTVPHIVEQFYTVLSSVVLDVPSQYYWFHQIHWIASSSTCVRGPVTSNEAVDDAEYNLVD